MADKQKRKKNEEEMVEEFVEEFVEQVEEVTEEKKKKPDEEDREMVTVPLKDYAEQLEELDDLRKKVDEFSAGWQRERADFSNYRKRIAQNQELDRSTSRIDIIRKYLDVHDDLERALKNVPEEMEKLDWVGGIRLIDQKLRNVLESEGVERIPAEEQEFDPNLHEAISHEENPDFESGEIIEVVQQGYTLGDRVVRPARVRVAK